MDDEPIVTKFPNPGEPEGNGHASAPPPIDLVIRFHPATQKVEVSGPVDQRILCYGMLEIARAIIDGSYLKQEIAQSSRIVPASGPLPPFPRA